MSLPYLISLASAACCAALALYGLTQARRAAADWAFAAGMAMLALERLCGGLSLDANTFGVVEQWQQRRFVALALLPGPWLLFSLTYARGNADVFLKKWRYALAGAFILPLGISLAFREDLLDLARTGGGQMWMLRLGLAGMAAHILVVIACVLVLMNLERTFRASVGTMRWRIKFMLLGVGVFIVVRIYTCSQALLYRGIDSRLESVDSIGALVAMLVIARSFWRSGRFNADVYPSQVVLEGSLTVLLAGIYLLVVGVLAKLATYLGGDTGFALKALFLLLALVLLAVMLQSDRVRLLVRQLVNRYFQRPIYDYRAVWRNFSEGTASCVDQTELCRTVVKLTADVFQALSVTIWLVNEKKDSLNLAASTSLSEARAGECAPEETEARAVIAYFEHHLDPIDIESATDAWSAALRRWHPSQFPNGGNRVCVPMVRQGRIVGVMMVGDRVNGIAFPLQDLDMLKCVADHATASLLNVQLSERVLQAKEHEAFQTMAAFFVHDLKNAASTLNLMLKNLPVHFKDPAFMEDALRGISKTAAHINRLIGRLGLLRHELKIQPEESDLNEVVARALATLEGAAGSKLMRELPPLPKIPLDREQFLKVVTNLILNATEAAPSNGAVRIATGEINGWVVLTVADRGCGMSAEFLKHSLFRPFQTTKKNGLGIGMFQSKMIVEAHGGRIAVASEPGKGTTFEVFLPMPKPSGK